MALTVPFRRRPSPPERRRARAYRANKTSTTSTDPRNLAQQLVSLRQLGYTPATLALTDPGEIRAALTAASTRVENDTSQDLRRLIQPWQARALTYYDMIGEVNFASQFYSRSLAKVRLFPAVLDENGDAQESDDETLQDLWSRVQDPSGGRSELQASYGRLMFVIGEGYLTCTPDPDWGETWEFLSPDELRVDPGGVFVRYRAPQIGTQEYVNAPDTQLQPEEGSGGKPDQVIAYRLWKKHPRYSWWADSSMHGVLDVLEELLLLTLAVRSQAKSRAANNGILLWPDEISQPQLDTQGDEDLLVDPFFEDFAASYVAPMTDPGSASAGTPLMVRMAAELIPEANGGPRFITLNANDAYAETGMRSELIRRFAMGADLPPEQVLGLADSNHWTGWIIDSQTWKAHLLPVTQQMCNDFGSSYLRPAARDAGFTDWKKVVVGYDATEVINHPDRGKDAMDAYNARAIGKAALREAKGFDDDDAPTEAELNEMIGVQIHDGSLAVYGIPSVRTAIEPEAGEIESAVGQQTATEVGPVSGAEVEPGPPPAGDIQQRAPVNEASLTAARILGAADAAVDRCRELAGAKIRSRLQRGSCDECLTQIDGVAPALVASTLGASTLEEIRAPHPGALVAGGARLFQTATARYGLNGHTAALGEMIEQHAAATLTEASAPPLPEAFLSLVEEALVA